MRFSSLILAAGLLAVGLPALAAGACSIPANLAAAPVIVAPVGEVVKGVTNAFYLLSLNWTPQWCRSGGAGATAKEMECDQPFGFSLHGLWPNGFAKPYPRFCSPVGRLESATVRQMFCRTPSPTLLQHEWQAHGSCGWTDPKAYFAEAARLYDHIALPKVEAIAPDKLTAGVLRDAFIAANPSFAPDGVFVQTTKDQELTEVRLCYDLGFKPTACPGGTGAANSVHIRLAPSRTAGF